MPITYRKYGNQSDLAKFSGMSCENYSALSALVSVHRRQSFPVMHYIFFIRDIFMKFDQIGLVIFELGSHKTNTFMNLAFNKIDSF